MLSLILLITGNIAHGMCCWKAQLVAPAPVVQSPTVTVATSPAPAVQSMAERERLAQDLASDPEYQTTVTRMRASSLRSSERGVQKHTVAARRPSADRPEPRRVTVGLSMAEREQLARDLVTRYPATQLAVARIEIENTRRQDTAQIQQILEERIKYGASMAIVDGAHQDLSMKQLAKHRTQSAKSQH